MNRFVKLAVVMGVAFGFLFGVLAVRSVAAAGDDSAVLKADQSLLQALAKGDKAGVDALLDAKFEWTDVDGNMRNRAEALRDLAALAKDNEGDTDVQTHFYGELDIVFGFHHNARFSRIWVKRPAGWRLITDLDTAKPLPAAAAAAATVPAANKDAGDCDYPCRTLPYKPTTAADKAVLKEWQITKMDEWHPNAADWETHVADDFLIMNDRSERNKAERVAFAKKLQEAGVSAPGDPIVSLTLQDFGNAVLMISHHTPYRGGKPYYNVRVFVKHGNGWPIAWSQQTTNQSAAPVPAVGKK
jgi:hypothetical protein